MPPPEGIRRPDTEACHIERCDFASVSRLKTLSC
jgi:hypothetical protein